MPSEWLEQAKRLLAERQWIAALEALGALLRRPLSAEEDAEVEQLCVGARDPSQSGDAGDIDLTDAPELEGLERALRELDESGEAQLRSSRPCGALRDEAAQFVLLEQRERLEAVAWGARQLGLPLDSLWRRLQRIDRLGQRQIRSFLCHNAARREARARLDPDARDGWWWSLRVDCEPDGLAALALGGADDVDDRRRLKQHLRGCADCQRELGLLQRLDALLGAPDEDHLSVEALSAHAAGEGSAAQRDALSRHLAQCPQCRQLLQGASAGLAEAEQVEAGLALLAAGQDRIDEVDVKDGRQWLHLPLGIGEPVEARALAADPALADDAPLPQRRSVLLEQASDYRLVYWAVAGRGQLGLFADRPDRIDLSVSLEGRALGFVEEVGARLFDLGPVARLAGCRLEVELTLEGQRQRRSWTLVQGEV